MTPTKSQLEAITRFSEWLPTSEKYFVLRAGAGRGKSWTTLNGFLPSLSKKPSSYKLLATTKQACDSLTKILSSERLAIDPQTVHSFIGASPTTKSYVHTNPEQFRECGYFLKSKMVITLAPMIIVIDEAFRLDQLMLDLLDYYLPNARYVMIGDPFQTPPVGVSHSPVEDLTELTYTLNETPRFKQYSPLSDLVNTLLLAVEYKEKDYMSLIPTESDKGIHCIRTGQLEPELRRRILDTEPVEYTDFCILTATRKKADDYNNYVVQTRAKAGLSLFNKGEKVIIDTVVAPDHDTTVHWMRQCNQLPSASATRFAHDNAKSLINTSCSQYERFLNKIATPLMVEGRTLIYLLSGDGGKGLSGKRMAALWGIHRETQVSFVFVRPSIAKTIHLAQGITSSNVYVDIGSIEKWHDDDMKRRLFYTAFSRCSSDLFLMR
jgi:hypothetical protein